MTEKIVVHTPTEEDWNEVVEMAGRLWESEWFTNVLYSSSSYDYNSCIHINAPDLKTLSYGSISFYENMGWKVISMEEFRKFYDKGVFPTVKEASVGDITSTAKGSGARYNNGKPDYSLLVISDIVPLFSANSGLSPHYDMVVDVIVKLGVFQQTHDSLYLNHIIEMLGKEAIEESTHVFTYGANKYAAWNWIKGMNWSVPLACAVRHSLKILEGEEIDEESGRKHLGHIVCNVFMLIHYNKYYKEGNDLPSKEYFNA